MSREVGEIRKEKERSGFVPVGETSASRLETVTSTIQLLDGGLMVAEGLSRLDTVHSKYRLLCGHVSTLYTVLERVLDLFSEFTKRITHVIRDLQKLNQGVLDELLDVFVKMKDSRVEFLSTGNEETLLDFVDTGSVGQLHTAVSQQTNELGNLLNMAEEQSSQTAVRVKNVASIGAQLSSLTSNPEVTSSLRSGDPNVVTQELHTRLLKHLNAITGALTNQSSPSTFSGLTGVKGEVSQIEEMGKATTTCLKSYRSDFSELIRLFRNILREISGLDQHLGFMENLILRFKREEIQSRSLVEEVSALTMWYHLSIEGHSRVISEISRRQQQLAEQQRVIDQMTAQLDSMWNQEENVRREFYEYYGRYLPETLCPELQISAERHHVFPRFCVSNLPRLSTSSLRTSSPSTTTTSCGEPPKS